MRYCIPKYTVYSITFCLEQMKGNTARVDTGFPKGEGGVWVFVNY